MIPRIINAWIDRMFLVFFLILMLIGAYTTYDTWYVRNVSSGKSLYVFRPEEDDPEAYTKLSREAVAWITVPDTTLDYPIMQTDNNTKYLNTAPDGSYSLAGSIFLDFSCDSLFGDTYTLIYGHHMADGMMFGSLDLFAEKGYFDAHRDAYLTFGGKSHKARIFAMMYTDAREQAIFDPAHNQDPYDFIRAHAMYFDEPVSKDRIVALSTCKEPGSTERTIVFLSFRPDGTETQSAGEKEIENA